MSRASRPSVGDRRGAGVRVGARCGPSEKPRGERTIAVPLDWLQVRSRYGGGAEIPTVAGGKTITIVGADEVRIFVRSHLWEAALHRENLERAVELIEAGVISRDPRFFVDDYKVLVADERATTVAHILMDLGFLVEGLGPIDVA